MQLFKMESSDNTEKILPRTIEVAKIIILTYLILTSLCAISYWFFGMNILVATHSFTTIATGGFSTHDEVHRFF